MEWIRTTEKNQNDIRVGDFVSATYSGIIYKVLKVEHVKDKIFLDVGVCDKKGNIESEVWIYRHQGIVCFNAYSPRNRKAQVVWWVFILVKKSSSTATTPITSKTAP